MRDILLEIQSIQSKGNGIYTEGIFPSQRCHKATGIKREDDNLFFTSVIAFTLKRLQNSFSGEERAIADDIIKNASRALPLYKNKKGEKTYNFWRKAKRAHFPNGMVFSRLNRFQLPDDADSTSLAYLAFGYSDADVFYLKSKLVHHSGLHVRKTEHLLPKYKSFKLYSTWFGKAMPIDADICVICNILYLVFENGSELNQYDRDSIKFICSVINNDEHKTRAFKVSPHYASTSVILYHVCRLLTIAKDTELLGLKAKLTADIQQILSGKHYGMESIFLSTALLWLGQEGSVKKMDKPSDKRFSWFIADMLTTVENNIISKLASKPLFHLQYYCGAYMKALYLEYLVERNKKVLPS